MALGYGHHFDDGLINGSSPNLWFYDAQRTQFKKKDFHWLLVNQFLLPVEQLADGKLSKNNKIYLIGYQEYKETI